MIVSIGVHTCRRVSHSLIHSNQSHPTQHAIMSLTSSNNLSFDPQTKLGKSTLDFCKRNGFDHTEAVKVFKKPTDGRLQKCVKKAIEVQTDPSNDYIAVHGWSIFNTKDGQFPTAEWHCVNYSPSIDAKNKAKDWKKGEKIQPAWIDTNADISSFIHLVHS